MAYSYMQKPVQPATSLLGMEFQVHSRLWQEAKSSTIQTPTL